MKDKQGRGEVVSLNPKPTQHRYRLRRDTSRHCCFRPLCGEASDVPPLSLPTLPRESVYNQHKAPSHTHTHTHTHTLTHTHTHTHSHTHTHTHTHTHSYPLTLQPASLLHALFIPINKGSPTKTASAQNKCVYCCRRLRRMARPRPLWWVARALWRTSTGYPWWRGWNATLFYTGVRVCVCVCLCVCLCVGGGTFQRQRNAGAGILPHTISSTSLLLLCCFC